MGLYYITFFNCKIFWHSNASSILSLINYLKRINKKGKTLQKSYTALINLYSLTNEQFNETLHEKVKLSAEKVSEEFDWFLDQFTKNDFEKVDKTIIEDKYVRFEITSKQINIR